jgi:hypothetical protein
MPKKDERFNIDASGGLGDEVRVLAESQGKSRSRTCRELIQEALTARQNKGLISDEQAVLRSLDDLSLSGLTRVVEKASQRIRERLPPDVADKVPVKAKWRNTLVALVEQNLDSVSKFFIVSQNGEERLQRILRGEKPCPDDLPLLEAGLPATSREQLEEICEKEFENGTSYQECCSDT